MIIGNQGLREIYGPVTSCNLTKLSGEQPGTLPLTVLFTTVSDTLEALKTGAKLAHQLGARIRVLFPSVVPYPLDLCSPRMDTYFRLRYFRTVCAEQPVYTWIDVRLCRDAWKCVHESLPAHSLVLIGGRKGWWPFAYLSCLERSLRRSGHEVMFIEASGKQSQSVYS